MPSQRFSRTGNGRATFQGPWIPPPLREARFGGAGGMATRLRNVRKEAGKEAGTEARNEAERKGEGRERREKGRKEGKRSKVCRATCAQGAAPFGAVGALLGGDLERLGAAAALVGAQLVGDGLAFAQGV